jgi:hypothetical protein
MNNQAAYNAYVASIIASNQALFAAATTGLGGNLNNNQLNSMMLNGSILANIPTNADVRNIQVIFYADEQQVYSVGVTSQEPVRIPVTGKAYVWEIKISGNVPVRSFVMGTSIGETRAVS